MQTAPVYSAPTTFAQPMMYAAPGGAVPVYGAPMPGATYAAPGQPVPTMMAPTYAAPVPSAGGQPPAEPVGTGGTGPVDTTTTTVAGETAVLTQTFPIAPRTSPLQTIMGSVTQAEGMMEIDC
eukprot:Skav212530  [mRNA]  locus=scaffold1851:34071:34439:+ [translate_table: standard]